MGRPLLRRSDVRLFLLALALTAPADAQLLPGFGDPRWAPDNGVWEIGTPSSGPGACFTADGPCAATVLNGNYDPNTDSRLVSPSVNLPSIAVGEELQLRF